MTRCCVAEPLVQAQLGAVPPIITAPSHLSRFNNFGCRVCVQSACWEQKGSLTITKQASYPHARVREKREEKEKLRRRISHLLLSSSSLLYVSALKVEEIAHHLQVSRQRFAPCVLPQMFLLNLFVLSSCFCIILSGMCCLQKEKLLSFTLPENCITEIKGRSYSRKTSSQACQNGWFLVIHRGFFK